jgi:phosphatidylserine/phosphatidylglycerophosphate/cardiolipin synthase-like enzyme
MNIKKAIYLIICIISSQATQAMKRSSQPSNFIIESPIKRLTPTGLRDLQPFLLSIYKPIPETTDSLLEKIQNSIAANDPITITNLLEDTVAQEISTMERKELYDKAIEKKRKMLQDNSPSSNINEIIALLGIFWALPTPQFPYVFVSPAPYERLTDIRIDLDKIIEGLILNEKEKIYVCCFHITLTNIGTALLNQSNEGVKIDVITNQEQGKDPNSKWVITNLKDNNISIRMPKTDPLEQMHHKFFIFQKNIYNKRLLLIGSYNPTNYGKTHSWDDILILDDQKIIDQYVSRFEEIKQRSQEYR